MARLWHGRIDSVGHGVQLIGEQAGVEVEGHSCRGVPKHRLHGLDDGARGDGQRSRSVPQIVRADVLQASRRAGRVEDS